MKKLIFIVCFFPFYLFAQTDIEVNEQDADNGAQKYKKPIKNYRVETSDGKIREVIVQPATIGQDDSTSPDGNESNETNNDNTNNGYIKPE